MRPGPVARVSIAFALAAAIIVPRVSTAALLDQLQTAVAPTTFPVFGQEIAHALGLDTPLTYSATPADPAAPPMPPVGSFAATIVLPAQRPFTNPFAGTLQFLSTIVASIDTLAHELAAAFIPHRSQLTDSSNPNVSNNLNPPPATNPFTAAVADAIPNTATSSQTNSEATSDQTTQSQFVNSAVVRTPASPGAASNDTTIYQFVKSPQLSPSEQYQFDALSNRLSNLTAIVGNVASLLPSLAQNENSATAPQFLGDGNPEAIGAGAAIDQLSNVTITNPSISGLSASDIPNLSGSYLSLGGGTLTGAFADSGTATSSFAGALGIGTTSPSDVLAVNGPIYLANVTPAATANRLYSNAGSLYWAGSPIAGGSVGNWTTDGTSVWRTGGNVGIGTTSPFTALSVVGNGYLTGALTAASINAMYATTTNLYAAAATIPSLTVGSVAATSTATSTFTGPIQTSNIIAKGPWVDVRFFGAIGNGIHDDTSAIQAAIDYIDPTGGTVLLPPGKFLISSTLVIASSSVTIEGSGYSFDPLNSNDSPWAPTSELLWSVSATGGPFISIGGTNDPVSGDSFTDFSMDGNNTATDGIDADQMQFGSIQNIGIRNITGIGLYGYTDSSNATIDFRNNTIQSVSVDNAAQIVKLVGNAAVCSETSNASHDSFTDVSGSFTGTSGIDIVQGDNNTFSNIMISRRSGTGYGIYLDAAANSNYFFHVEAGGGTYAATPCSASDSNEIYGYDKSNGEANPIVASGANLTYTEDSLNSTGWNIDSKIAVGSTTPALFPLDVFGDSGGTLGDSSGQFAITGFTNSNQRLSFGYQTDNNDGFIQALTVGSAFNSLNLNPRGGNVGIGTTSPGTTFAVASGSSAFGGPIVLDGSATNGGGLTYASSSIWYMYQNSDGSLHIAHNGFDPVVQINRSNNNFLYTGGNFGIGTTTPGSLLSLNNIANFTTATSTYYSTGGINLTSGCFAVNGNCLSLGTLSGTLGVANGGTGSTTLSGIIVGNGAGAAQTAILGGSLSLSGSTLQDAWVLSGSSLFNKSGTNIGIGTTTPQQSLAVAGTIEGQNLVIDGSGPFSGSAASSSAWTFYQASDNSLHLARIGWNYLMKIDQSNNVTFNTTGGNNNLFISGSTGNLGIGTTSPLSVLAVSGGASIGANYNMAAPSNGLIVQGNVGIGTSSPFMTSTPLTVSVPSGGQLDIDAASGQANLTLSQSGVVNGGLNATGGAGNDISLKAGRFLNFVTNGVTRGIVGNNQGNGSAGGNFGIGTTTPWSLLSVGGGASIGADYAVTAPTNGLIVEGNVGIGTSTPYARLSLSANSGDTNTTLFAIASSTISTTTTLLSVSNIGTTILKGGTTGGSGQDLLDLQNGSGINILRFIYDQNGNPSVYLYQADSSLHTYFSGYYATAFNPSNYAVTGGLDIGAAANNDNNGGFGIAVESASAKGAAYFNGNVGIATTSPYSRLEVWGPDTASTTAFLVANSASTTEFAVYDNGNATLAGGLTQNSDQRLKTNIQSLNGSSTLAAIDNLNPVTFNWIDPNQGSTPQLGFIAQQVQTIFPNLVSTTSPTALTPNGTLSLNYIGLVSPIVSAIQALSSEITSLETTIAGFAQSFTSAVGNFGQVNTNDLCVGSTCVTPAQFQAMVAAANQSSAPQSSEQGSSSGQSTATASSSSDSSATPPVLQVNGDNPAIIQVGATYTDLGAQITGPQQDLNLGIQAIVDGGATTTIGATEISTSQPGTHTIEYVATDQNGLKGTATRTVDVMAPTGPTQSPAATSTAPTAADSGDPAASTEATSTAQ